MGNLEISITDIPFEGFIIIKHGYTYNYIMSKCYVKCKNDCSARACFILLTSHD